MLVHGGAEPFHDAVEALPGDEANLAPFGAERLQGLEVGVPVVGKGERLDLLQQRLLQGQIRLLLLAAVCKLGLFGFEEHVLGGAETLPELVLVAWRAGSGSFPSLLQSNHGVRRGLPIRARLKRFGFFNQFDLLLFGHFARGLDAVVKDLLALKEHVRRLAELPPKGLVVLLAGEAHGFPLALQVDDLFGGGLPAFVVVDVFGQDFLKGGDERFLLGLVHLKLGADAVVVGLHRVEGFARQPKERVRQLLVSLPRRRPHVEPLLLQASRQRLALLEVLDGGERFRLLDQPLLQHQVFLQVVLLKLLVDVDVVEKLVAETVVFVVDLLVAVAGHVACGLPLLAHLVEPRERRPDVFFFLDGLAQLVDECGLHLEVGPLAFCNALAPSLFTFLELGHQVVERQFFRAGLEFEFLVGFAFFFFPSVSLGAEVFLNQTAKGIDLGAHILADGLQILVGQEGLDTLQNF